MERALIIGAKGMLGKAVVPLFSERYEVLAVDIEECDITKPDVVLQTVSGIDPRFVIHLASMTDVDGCETDPDRAYLVNTLGTRNVALACQSRDAVMVYISTGMVYGGTKTEPYIEFDTPDPINVYARSKYYGECYIRDLLSRYYIFYTCWLFGGGPEDKKFVSKILHLARERKELKVINDKFGSPTYTVDLAEAIYSFIESGLYGKYHCVNTGCVNRFEIAEEILRIAGLDGCRLIPVSSDELPLQAPRPRMEAMRNYHFELLGIDPLRGWREALAEYLTPIVR